MQPFMKNVAVEYAAKALPDSELAQALDTLQQAIDGKIGFDGRLDLIIIQGPSNKYQLSQESIDYIKSSTNTRLVRTNAGTFATIGYAGTRYYFTVLTLTSSGIYSANYIIPIDIQPNTDLEREIINSPIKLYRHSFAISDSQSYPSNSISVTLIRTTASRFTDVNSAITGILQHAYISETMVFSVTEGTSSYSTGYVSHQVSNNALTVINYYMVNSEIKFASKTKSSGYLFSYNVTEV